MGMLCTAPPRQGTVTIPNAFNAKAQPWDLDSGDMLYPCGSAAPAEEPADKGAAEKPAEAPSSSALPTGGPPVQFILLEL